MYAGESYHNMLPRDLKDCAPLNKFKSKLKSLLTLNGFYTLGEFSAYFSAASGDV